MTTRADRIHQYVIGQTELFCKQNNIDNNGCEASIIASDLKLDRSNVSRELNRLWKEGKLVKIQGRPILFLDYQTLKDQYGFQYIPLLIPAAKNITSYLNDNNLANNNIEKKNSLTRIIGGTNGSLVQTVNNVIAAISYKPYSLPILIIGNKGVRKRRFVNSIYDYTLEKSIKQADSKLLIINCAEYTENEEGFLNCFFGNGNNKGVLESSNKGVVYLQNIHTLSKNLLSTISDCISFNYFFRQNDSRKRKFDASLIASINNECDNSLQVYLKSFFPVVAQLPSFSSRNLYEKIEIILNMFTEEAQQINKNIILTKSIVGIFIQHKYNENEREIKNLIRFTCANCLLRNAKYELNAITIEIDDLPNILLSDTMDEQESSAFSRALSLYQFDGIVCEKSGSCQCYDFFFSIQQNYVNKNLKDFTEEFKLTEDNIEEMDTFIDNCLSTITKCDQIHYNEIRRNVDNEVRMAFLKNLYHDDYYFQIVNRTRSLYAAMLVVSNYLKNNDNLLYQKKTSQTKEQQDSLKICQYLKINNSAIEAFIEKYLLKAKLFIDNTKVSLLIVTRGNSIASELAQIIKPQADNYQVRVEAINYNSTVQYNDILELVINKLKDMETDAGTIILVDGYPLSDIEQFVSKESEVKCKVYSGLNIDMLYNALDCCNESYSLEKFIHLFNSKLPKNVEREEKNSDFIQRLINDAFNKTATHINPTKAVNVLLESLDTITDELKINKSKEIIVKYLSHGVHMLERIIKNNPLQYYQLKQFTNNNHNLMDVIAESLVGAENTFDIHIPSSEIAYLAEIFLEGL